MSTFQIHNTVGELVAQKPSLSRVFEQVGIDYCCGGKKTIQEVSQKKGIDPQALIATLEEFASSSTETDTIPPALMTLTELANHIEQTHHAYLKTELPRLDMMTNKVAAVHGEHNERLYDIRQTFLALAQEMSSHMMKEEQILFPMIRQMELGASTAASHCGSVANPIRQMEAEHDQAGDALEKIQNLTDNYVPPDWACNTYRAMLDALSYLQKDMHQHVHKENNVLFPRAIEAEKSI